MDDRITSALDKLNIPYVIVVGNSMYEYPAAIRFLGRLTGRTQRAKLLAKTSEGILSHVSAMMSKVPPGQRPRVYYAEGPDGLSAGLRPGLQEPVGTFEGDDFQARQVGLQPAGGGRRDQPVLAGTKREGGYLDVCEQGCVIHGQHGEKPGLQRGCGDLWEHGQGEVGQGLRVPSSKQQMPKQEQGQPLGRQGAEERRRPGQFGTGIPREGDTEHQAP